MCACTPEEGIRSHCRWLEPPCCWKLNSGPLEEQPMLLTPEPSHQLPPCAYFFLNIIYSVSNYLQVCKLKLLNWPKFPKARSKTKTSGESVNSTFPKR